MHGKVYLRLTTMMVLSFIAMYVLMYAMVDRFADVYPSVNQAYMAGLMAAPMLLIELGLMRRMYPQPALNTGLVIVGLLVFASCWFAIRAQVGVNDRQFLKSMIPHHSGAILMCSRSSITDKELKALCEQINRGQQSEIDQMKQMLSRLDGR